MKRYEDQARPIVYLDESGFALDMPWIHGYAPKGKRCYGQHDWHSKGRVNAIGAMIGRELLTVSLFESSINSDIFYAWLKQDLLPKVTKGSVIVMDNASFHKRADMLTAIAENQCILEFMPPYSPDLNPIEKKWAQAKARRKKYRCSVDSLFAMYLDYAKL
jgi:transposase